MKIFESIPTEEPLSKFLGGINSPEDLRKLDKTEIPLIADELREFLLYTVGKTGGHFGAGLGVIELTLALHYAFETPHDRLVWDVGHQTYPHKILTGRKNDMESMRQTNGLAPFPVRTESEYDTFGVGHSSTSISAALGMAIANRYTNKKVVAVIGDGAMTAGMAFEALNHAGIENSNLSLDDIYFLIKNPKEIKLNDSLKKKIKLSYDRAQKMAMDQKPIYGVNTGVGPLCLSLIHI